MQEHLERIINEVCQEEGIPYKVACKAYMAQWDFIYKKVSSLPLKQIETKEEFRKLRTNFNIPSFGKLFVTEEDFLRKKESYNRVMAIKRQKDVQSKENQADVQPDSDDSEHV